MYCRQCGKEIGEGKFCPYCGAQQEVSNAQEQSQGYQPISNQSAQPPHYVAPDDESSFGFAILSFFIPIVGLILFIVWNKEYPRKAKSCLNGFIGSIIFYVVIVCCLLSSAMYAANEYSNGSYDSDYWNIDAVVETVPYE